MDTEREFLELEWSLEGLLSDGKRWIIPIDPLPFTIGRHADNHLVISAKSISRNHAEIFIKESGLWIRDLDSKNGTHVNRQRIDHPTRLHAADVVHFGTVEFRIGLKESAPTVEETSTTGHVVSDLSALFHSLEPDLKKMIREGAVLPHFQPILDLGDHSLYGYEILGRGLQAGLPTLPLELFSIAEGLGCEAELSRLFWTRGIMAGMKLPGSPRLFVNIHPSEIGEATLITALRDMRRRAPSTRITLEISEKAVTNLTQMCRLRGQLQELDIHLAYDDFGAGQARFLELVEVPPHMLKFDIGLIGNIHRRPKRLQQLVGTLVNMAREMGITTLAEGVECEEEAEVCSVLGFQYAQGFHYGRPVPMGAA